MRWTHRHVGAPLITTLSQLDRDLHSAWVRVNNTLGGRRSESCDGTTGER